MSQLGHDPHGCDLSMSQLRHDSQPVYKTGNDYSLAGNSPFQLIYLRFICYYKLIGVLTVLLSLSISHGSDNHVMYYSTVEIGAI